MQSGVSARVTIKEIETFFNSGMQSGVSARVRIKEIVTSTSEINYDTNLTTLLLLEVLIK